MVLSCKEKEAVSCAEDAVQVRRRRRCYYGPGSDAEFLRSIADKTPGREDENDQMRRRQAYLKSYVFVSKDDETRGGGGGALLLRHRYRHHQQTTSTSSSSSSSSRWWCPKKAGKVLSHLLNRLLACTCTSNYHRPASAPSSSHAGAAAVD